MAPGGFPYWRPKHSLLEQDQMENWGLPKSAVNESSPGPVRGLVHGQGIYHGWRKEGGQPVHSVVEGSV
jgi:hypothetical protein